MRYPTVKEVLNNAIFWILAGVIIVLLLIVVLLSVRRKKAKKAETLAGTDPVTGGLSAERFYAAASALATETSIAFVTLNVSNYLVILDTFGEANAARVLRHIHSTITSILGKEPCARIDRATFSFVLRNAREEEIKARLSMMTSRINSYGEPALDIRFGVYVPKKGEGIDIMRERAASVLAPEADGEHIRFCKAADDNKARFELAREFEHAAEKNELLVYLQPKVRLGDLRIVGAEALVRWRHPRKGMLTGDMFIPALSQYGLMPKLDTFMFEAVLDKLAEWQKEGIMACPISINLSLESFEKEGFALNLANSCTRRGIDPELIEFELDEKALTLAPKRLKAAIDELHKFEFLCSLDNFGRTSIPLHLLRELDADVIKLSSTLFSGENNSRRNRFCIEAILKLASQMRIRTVAEGIDNASQIEYLKQAACDMIQGFCYFRPMSADEFRRTAFHEGELCYVEEPEKAKPAAPAVKQTSDSIVVMFSLEEETDHITFSEPFSPVLQGGTSFSSGLSFFKHSPLIHENDKKDFLHLLERCKREDGWVSNTLRFYTAEDHYEWLEVHLHRNQSVSGDTVIMGTFVNMSGWKNEVDRLKEKANRDALTGLYNREFFESHTANILKKGALSQGAVVFIDVDDFKQVNDTLGHVVGDDVLCYTAKRVLGVFRHSDIVARYGGDEFVAFVNGIGEADLIKRLTQLCESFNYPYRNGDIEYKLGISIGAALYPNNGTDYSELLDNADNALYAAKNAGKNRFELYVPGMEEVVYEGDRH